MNFLAASSGASIGTYLNALNVGNQNLVRLWRTCPPSAEKKNGVADFVIGIKGDGEVIGFKEAHKIGGERDKS